MGTNMKLILTEQQFKTIILEWDDDEDFYSGLSDMTYHVFNSIKNREKIRHTKINPVQYKNALIEFTKFGEFFRFPTKIINNWKNICLRNTLLLAALTDIYGHSQHFPFDEFYDVFEIPEEEQSHDWEDAFNLLDNVFHIDEYTPKFSNGHELISDYGLKPLYNLCLVLLKQNDPNEIIVTINKILDISHQRSDLAELFIEGGSKSLDMITNS